MSTAHNSMVARGLLTPGDSATETLTVSRVQLKAVRSVTVWVFPQGQAVTIDWRATGVQGNVKLPAERTGPINRTAVTAVAAPAGQWTPTKIDDSEVLLLGDLLIDITAGGTAPADVTVLVMGFND